MIIEKILEDWEGVELKRKRKMVIDYLNERAKELPEDVVAPSIMLIRQNIDEETRCEVVENFEKYGGVWWTRPDFHYHFGVKVRNMLRDLVCNDDVLQTKNWDDYWQIVVEIALGLRNETTREYTREVEFS